MRAATGWAVAPVGGAAAGSALKILHVYKTYYPDTLGGMEQVLAQLGRALISRGHENRIYTISPLPHPPMLCRPEGEVYRSRRTLEIASVPLSVPALFEFREHAHWADVIHYHFPWPLGDVLHLLWARGKPSVVTYQSDIVKQKLGLKLYAPMQYWFLRAVDSVVTTSVAYRDSSPVLSRLPRPVTIIPNGADEDSLPKPDAARMAHWRAQVGEDFFLFVGVLRYYKGLHTLLEAARGLPARIVIAGEGPEAEALRQSIGDGLANVTMLGRVTDTDKAALLRLCRAFVFPSHLRSEAFGMSLVEASMYGKPMVSCEIATGTSWINQDGVTGWVVPPEEPQALRAAMQKLLEDGAAAQRMGAAARRRYEAIFTGGAMARAYERTYREAIAARAAGRAPRTS